MLKFFLFLPQKDFSKYLIVLEVFVMFRFSFFLKWKKNFFFSESFNFEPRHNEVIPNCGELNKKYYCLKKIFQNN